MSAYEDLKAEEKTAVTAYAKELTQPDSRSETPSSYSLTEKEEQIAQDPAMLQDAIAFHNAQERDRLTRDLKIGSGRGRSIV